MATARRLKVLFITSWYPTKERPVGGVFVREHAKAVQLYDDVVVLHCAGGDPRLNALWQLDRETDADLTEGIPIYRIWYRPSLIPKTSYFIYLWSVIRAFRRLATQGFYPDVIHAHLYAAGVPAVLIGKLHGIPVVVTEHSTAFPRKSLSRIEILKVRFAFRSAKLVLPVSHALQKAIEEYQVRAQFRVVPNVVDTELYSPAPQTPNERHSMRFLCVGLLDLSHKKGVPYLLEACARLRQKRDDWHLDVLGDGPARQYYERLAIDLQIDDKVTFHGLKAKRDVAEFMRNADFFVLPSVYETFSVATAEALATGLPVLATRCGGPEEFVTDDVGVLVPPGDTQILFEGLDFMCSHLERFSHDLISRYATECFSPERVGNQLQAVYQMVVGSGSDTFGVGYSGQKVTISKQWRVLDLGSGHNPHPRADVLLDKALQPHVERSGRPASRDGRPLVLGDASCLPLGDRSFDYVVATHVAEHVPDPVAFCSELQRVARRGYIECPGPVGELLLGEPFHIWIVSRKGGKLCFLKNRLLNSRLVRWISDPFYALFYVGQERARWTFRPKNRLVLGVLGSLSKCIGIGWRSPFLRNWTYTCLEFDTSLEVSVLER